MKEELTTEEKELNANNKWLEEIEKGTVIAPQPKKIDPMLLNTNQSKAIGR